MTGSLPKQMCRLMFAALYLVLVGAAGAAPAKKPPPPPTLTAFRDDAEMTAWFEALRKRYPEAPVRARGPILSGGLPVSGVAGKLPLESIIVTGSNITPADSMNITNVQLQGVDEGDIVKTTGDYLVILRRGRLFTVRVKDGALEPAGMANAYGPGIDPNGTWYDEMLVNGKTIVVVGYSYRREGTELGLFDMDGEGKITYRATWFLRSDDYYSARNYASRLVGNQLIFYTPFRVGDLSRPLDFLPGLRKWRHEPGAKQDDFKRITPATRIYRTEDNIDPRELTLHSVVTCDISKPEMSCEATAVLGPGCRIFFVSREAVYVWTSHFSRERDNKGASIFRMPFYSYYGEPTALKVRGGAPVDQFGFHESGGFLNVLVLADSRGDRMWSSEQSSGELNLLRVSLNTFGDAKATAPPQAYRRLPGAAAGSLQNRFVGPYLIYGTGNGWVPVDSPDDFSIHTLTAVRWAENKPIQSMSFPHSIDRIEIMGQNAVVIGTANSNLYFSTLKLDDMLSVEHRYMRENAAQGETRSHGFFYKPLDDDSGLIGLPVTDADRPGYRQLREISAGVLFLRNDFSLLRDIGQLNATAKKNINDACKASCTDWYGNARPIFLGNRILALLGYELVEGRLEKDTIHEFQRARFYTN